MGFLKPLLELLNKIFDYIIKKQEAENAPSNTLEKDEEKINDAIVDGDSGTVNAMFDELLKRNNKGGGPSK